MEPSPPGGVSHTILPLYSAHESFCFLLTTGFYYEKFQTIYSNVEGTVERTPVCPSPIFSNGQPLADLVCSKCLSMPLLHAHARPGVF